MNKCVSRTTDIPATPKSAFHARWIHFSINGRGFIEDDLIYFAIFVIYVNQHSQCLLGGLTIPRTIFNSHIVITSQLSWKYCKIFQKVYIQNLVPLFPEELEFH